MKEYFARLARIREIGVLIPTVLLAVLIGILNPVFFSFENAVNVLRSSSFLFLTGIGMTIVLISGGLDLSVGSVLALGSYVTSLALIHHVPAPLSILIGVATGVVVGGINGLVVVRLRVPPFIATLGMFYMAKGVVLVASKGVPLYPLPAAFNAIGQESLWGVPYLVFVAVIFGVLADFVLRRTIFGRTVYAIGGNEEAARFSGISVDGLKLWFYIIAGALAALTGLLQAARLGSAQPNIGQQFELLVIASVIIGGTSLFGGAGTILGTCLGVLFMTILTNGMSLLKVSPYWQQLAIGAIIILAVAVDRQRRRA